MRKLISLVMISSLILLSGCWNNEKQQGLFVVNVLSADYFSDCHIKGSINIEFDMDALNNFAQTLNKDTAEVVFYCSNYMCSASGEAAKHFKNLGFKHVYAYEAGMAEWYQKGFPVEGACTKPYLVKEIAHDKLDQTEEISIIGTEALAKKMNVTVVR